MNDRPTDGLALVGSAAVLVAIGARFGPRAYGYSERAAWLGGTVSASVIVVFTLFGPKLLGARLRALRGGPTSLPRTGAAALMAASVLLPAALSIRGLAGLTVTPVFSESRTVTVITDPETRPGGGTVLTLFIDGKRVRTLVFGENARSFDGSTAGSTFHAVVSVRPWPMEVPSWAISKHLAGQATVQEARFVYHGRIHWRAARWIRSTMRRGTDGLPPDQRALFGGFVLGDNRGRDDAVADDFRAAGLAHLLVVSGQNVAFVLVAFRPLLQRLPARLHAMLALGVILFFALLTRFEPSVIRASTMAALVVVSRSARRPQSSAHVLAITVICLLMIDPLLVWSVGFGLSVCATAGLAVLSQPIESFLSTLPVPKVAVPPLAATVAAQVGTFPLLVGLGGISPVSVPANLLALPAAEPLMIWGVLIGVPAGLLGGPSATILHGIDRVLIWWVGSVARVAGDVDRALGAPLWWPVPIALLLLWHGLRSRTAEVPLGLGKGQRGLTVVRWITLFGALVGIGWLVHDRLNPEPFRASPIGGNRTKVWRSSSQSVLLVGPGARSDALLRELRSRRITGLDTIVIEKPTNATWSAISPVASRYEPSLIVVCGYSTALGPIAVFGLGPADRLHVSLESKAWLTVDCNQGRAQVQDARPHP